MKYEIGSKIRQYREERGLSQKELAAQIGVSNSRVSNWEQGINRPDADILARLCQALRVSADDLLGTKQPAVEFNILTNVDPTPPDKELTFDDIQYALLEETKGLDDGLKEDILKYARYVKQLQDNNPK